jgi:sortase A
MFHYRRTLVNRGELTGSIIQGRKRRPSFWALIEYVFLSLGLILLAVFGALLFERAFSSRVFLHRFDSLDATRSASDFHGEKERVSAESHSSPRSEQQGDTRERGRSNQANTPLAVLHIPKLHLAVPLLDGTDSMTLNHAVGRIAGTAWPGESGNIGIAGHRDSFFRGLKDVKVGDAIELKTPTETDTYIVDQIQIVTPDAVDVLLPRPAPSVTLVTCYPFYFVGSAPQRFIVNASLTQQIESEPHRY